MYQQIETLRETKKLESWVYQITRNTIIDFYRSKRHIVSLDDPEVLQLPEDLPDDDIVSALFPAVRAMVNSLPSQDRQALILTEYQGLTQKELSERLGISLSGAKSRVQRARQRLKHQLLACCSFELDTRGHILNYVPLHGSCRDELCSPVTAQVELVETRPFPKSLVSLEREHEEEPLALLIRKERENYLMNSIPQRDEPLREAAGTALPVLGVSPTREVSCCGPSCCSPSETMPVQPTQGADTSSPCCKTSCCTSE